MMEFCELLGPYLTLFSYYTCPALRSYHFGLMRIPECNRKVTGNVYEAVDGYEVKDKRL